jgi:drug/metabolite transporter (DMT)-like permease
LAGLVSLVGYGATLFALRLAPTGIVSALREASVILATLIAAVVLREHVDRRRVAAAGVIVFGAIVILTQAGLRTT